MIHKRIKLVKNQAPSQYRPYQNNFFNANAIMNTLSEFQKHQEKLESLPWESIELYESQIQNLINTVKENFGSNLVDKYSHHAILNPTPTYLWQKVLNAQHLIWLLCGTINVQYLDNAGTVKYQHCLQTQAHLHRIWSQLAVKY